MVRSTLRRLRGVTLLLSALAAGGGGSYHVRGDDTPPSPKEDRAKTAPGGPEASDSKTDRARTFALPGEDPPQPFVPLKPRTVEDRRRVEALSQFATARAREDRRDWPGAIRLYEEALKLDPDSVVVLRRLSRLCFSLGRTDQGIAYSKRVLEQDPGDSETIARLVNYYGDRRKDPQGAEAILKGVLNNPKLAQNASGRLVAQYELGRLYAGRLGKINEAADAFARVIDALDDKAANRLSPADQRRILGSDEAAAYQAFGLVFLEAKRYELAVKAFERGVDYDPDDPQLPLRLAETLLKLKRYDRALAVVDSYVKRQPQDTEAYDLMAEALKGLKRGDEVIPRLEDAARRDSKNIVLQYLLADRLRESGQVEKAEALYKKLLTAQPTTQGYGALASSLLKRRKAADLIRVVSEAMGRPGGQAAVLETIRGVIGDPAFAGEVLDAGAKLLGDDPPGLAPPGAEVLTFIATRTGKLDKLLPVQRLQLKRSPNPQTYREVASVESALKKYGDAAGTLQEMMTRFPVERNARQLAELVRVLRLADRTDEALKTAREAVALDPNDADAQSQLATVLVQTGQTQEALAVLTGAVKKNPKNPEPALLLAETQTKVGRNEDAIQVLKGLLEKFPDNEAVAKFTHQMLSIAYVNLGDYRKGEAELETLLEKDPEDAGVNNDLGYLYAEQGKNLEKAESMVRKAVREQPDNYAYLDSLGWVLFKRGKVKEALEPLEKAAGKMNEAAADDPTIHEHLGDVYFQLGDTAKARTHWQTAEKAAAKSTPPDRRLPEIRKKLESLNKLNATPRPSKGDTP